MSGLEPKASALNVVHAGEEAAPDPNEIAMEAFGVRLGISATPVEVLDHIRPFFPPGWTPCPPSEVQQRFAIRADGTGTYEFYRNGRLHNEGLGLELAVMLIDTEMRLYIARKAPEAIFIHAGVVGHKGRAIIIPGMSFSGKTTLVAALIREGAIYYSDEFAVLGNDGLVHPYAKSLSLRGSDQMQVEHPVDALGGVAGDEGVPLGAIVVTSYKPDAEWEPEYLSAGEGAMALLANAVPARERPEEAMRALSRCAHGAVVVKSDRSEADQVARWLLAELDWPAATQSA
jgi:hypothetical protein